MTTIQPPHGHNFSSRLVMLPIPSQLLRGAVLCQVIITAATPPSFPVIQSSKPVLFKSQEECLSPSSPTSPFRKPQETYQPGPLAKGLLPFAYALTSETITRLDRHIWFFRFERKSLELVLCLANRGIEAQEQNRKTAGGSTWD